ncbi:hypothetical protein P5673_009410 [Acropora cervicornis]|uniref:Uncharacterized protein n=1 Tax=Acropora cervicornis TaxID=6130 RepID=A0AAD9QST7_ACRCE|nr:hypothetical protein P5673_009410 [Acropora cervicornis]
MALLIMIYPGIMCLILGLHDTFPSMKRQNGAPVVKFAPFCYVVQTHEFSPFDVTLSSKRENLSSSASKPTFLVETTLKKEATRKLQTIQEMVQILFKFRRTMTSESQSLLKALMVR